MPDNQAINKIIDTICKLKGWFDMENEKVDPLADLRNKSDRELVDMCKASMRKLNK